LKSNKRNINVPIKEEYPGFQLAGAVGTLGVDGSLFIGTAATPAFKIGGSYKSGCGRKKPEIEVNVSGSVSIKSGVVGELKTKFTPDKLVGLPVGGKTEVKGGIEGKIEFTYTYSSEEGKSKFCYKSDGLYVEGTGTLAGAPVFDLFPPKGKYYLIQPL